MSNPSLGSSLPARLSEWLRGHGGASLVVDIEDFWYSHHPPAVGGRPVKGAIPSRPRRAATGQGGPGVSVPRHLAAPAPIAPLGGTAIAGEGTWTAAGRLVHGVPAVYETYVEPDAVHTSVVIGVAWMDTTLLSARLYSGSTIPGGNLWTDTAPVPPAAATSLVAAFNSGFRMGDANGGYYSEGRTAVPLRSGAASIVIYRNGSVTVGQWGRDVSMTADVVSVRQNLNLLVDGGRPVPGIAYATGATWGRTLGNSIYVWRSGLGVTADGALVYVAGPALDVADLASVLVRAGAVRGMELDINTDWVNMATYAPAAGAPSSAANGTSLLPTMTGGPARYFEAWWSRDFLTMSAR